MPMTRSLELWLVAPDDVRVQNGERIKRAREEHQLGQRDVAEALNVSVSTVSNWERGKTVPRSRLAALEKLLHLSLVDTGATAEPDRPTALTDATDMELAMEFFRRMQSKRSTSPRPATPLRPPDISPDALPLYNTQPPDIWGEDPAEPGQERREG